LLKHFQIKCVLTTASFCNPYFDSEFNHKVLMIDDTEEF